MKRILPLAGVLFFVIGAGVLWAVSSGAIGRGTVYDLTANPQPETWGATVSVIGDAQSGIESLEFLPAGRACFVLPNDRIAGKFESAHFLRKDGKINYVTLRFKKASLASAASHVKQLLAERQLDAVAFEKWLLSVDENYAGQRPFRASYPDRSPPTTIRVNDSLDSDSPCSVVVELSYRNSTGL